MIHFLKKIILFLLELEAKLVLKKYKPIIVTITGSVGKTSTKDALYAMLSKFYYVRKNIKTPDNRIGFPLTILGSPNGGTNPIIWIKTLLKGLSLILQDHTYPHLLILETVVKEPGHIDSLLSWLYSDIVVITPFGSTPPHIEFFDSREHLIHEKTKILSTLAPSGILILNTDDEAIRNLQHVPKVRTFNFGFNENSMIQASHEHILYDDNKRLKGIQFKINYDGNSLPIPIEGSFGKNLIYAVLASVVVAREMNLNMITAFESLKHYPTPPGRMKLLAGVKSSSIIDDTYNSSPAATTLAIETLKAIETKGRKILVLGDMMDLGTQSQEEHKKIGTLAAGVADILITVGIRARLIAEGALNSEMDENTIFQYESAQNAGKFLEQEIKENDVILVKGSQLMRMERTVEEVMNNPTQKKMLLVRQGSEWI